MQRKLTGERVDKLPKDRNAYIDLKRKCVRWAADHLAGLQSSRPQLPPLHDRAADNWEPLLAIAEACSPDLAERARAAAVKLSGRDDDETIAIQLFDDLAWLFKRSRCDELGIGLASSEIIHDLAKLEDRPWPEFGQGGKPISARGLAKILNGFRIYPKQVKIRGGKWGPNGYEPKQFREVFRRYLPQKTS
jgi:putative DNA primase/helicase